MSKAKMRQARDLIERKQYDEARAILLTVDHPRARQWLAQLDKQQPRKRSGGGLLARLLGSLFTIIVSVLVTSGLIALLVMLTASTRVEQGQLRITETAVAIAAANATATPSPLPSPTLVPAIVNATENVNVRSAPDINSAAIVALVPGTQVEVIGSNDDASWYQVRLSSGQEGWLAASLLNVQAAVPTAVAQAATETATPSEVCTQQEAQTWYDTNRPTLNRVRYLKMQVDGAFAAGKDFDYSTTLTDLRALRSEFEAADTPGCLSQIRDLIVGGMQSFDNGLTNQINNFPDQARSEWGIADATFTQVDSQLADQFGVETTLNACGAEIWYTGLADTINEYLNLTADVTMDTGQDQETRNVIFQLQDIRRKVEVTLPDCVQTAAGHLYSSVDGAIAFYQAILSHDTPAKQRAFNQMNQERDAFFVEMNRLSVPVMI